MSGNFSFVDLTDLDARKAMHDALSDCGWTIVPPAGPREEENEYWVVLKWDAKKCHVVHSTSALEGSHKILELTEAIAKMLKLKASEELAVSQMKQAAPLLESMLSPVTYIVGSNQITDTQRRPGTRPAADPLPPMKDGKLPMMTPLAAKQLDDISKKAGLTKEECYRRALSGEKIIIEPESKDAPEKSFLVHCNGPQADVIASLAVKLGWGITKMYPHNVTPKQFFVRVDPVKKELRIYQEGRPDKCDKTFGEALAWFERRAGVELKTANQDAKSAAPSVNAARNEWTKIAEDSGELIKDRKTGIYSTKSVIEKTMLHLDGPTSFVMKPTHEYREPTKWDSGLRSQIRFPDDEWHDCKIYGVFQDQGDDGPRVIYVTPTGEFWSCSYRAVRILVDDADREWQLKCKIFDVIAALTPGKALAMTRFIESFLAGVEHAKKHGDKRPFRWAKAKVIATGNEIDVVRFVNGFERQGEFTGIYCSGASYMEDQLTDIRYIDGETL